VTVNDFPKIYALTRRFTTGAPRTFTVTSGGEAVLFLRSKGETDPVLCLWEADTSSGTERLVVDPTALPINDSELPAAERARRERARESANGIVGYSVSNETGRVCFALAGSLVVADIKSGEVSLPPVDGAVFDPRFSPDGSLIAYVANAELRVVDLAAASDRSIATDDSDLVTWGAAEFVAAEEMGRNRGYWWSPDSKSLLAAKVDNTPVDSWWIADPAHPSQGASEIRYPAAGTANARVELWLHQIASGGARTEIAWNSGSEFEYLANVLWPKESAPLVVCQPRDQRSISIGTVDVDSGAVTEVHKISNDTWVELIPGSPTWHETGLITVEDLELSDTRTLCLDGRPLTRPGLQVRAVLGVHQDTVTFTGSYLETEIHVFRLDLSDNSVVQLTSEPGVHSAVASEQAIVINSATPTQPGTTARVNGHVIASNAAHPPMAAEPAFHEFGSRALATAVFLPSDHDGTTPLPVLLDPYGGPHAQRVLKNHNPHLVSRWFAEQGFAVLVTDGRGTPGRGPAFEREVWGDLASPVLEDQLDALDGAAEHFGYLDLNRVGIRGWSFGGYLAALAAMRAPERIHAAIAGAPVTSWHLYDTHYTERYLGHPGIYPDHYEDSDLIVQAASLERPLLLIHGLADDNVVAAHTLQYSTALLAAGRPHQVLPLSGVTHMTPQVAVAENLLRLQLTFLQQHLS
jgi:dipeptidyl-peptidase-4